MFFWSACSPGQTTIGPYYYAGIILSQSTSTVTVSSTEVLSGDAISVNVFLKDSNGNAYVSSLPQITFQTSGGTSTGTFGNVTNNNDGSYTASFTGQNSGTATRVIALVDGVAIQTPAPSVSVTSGNFSLANSILTLSTAVLASAASATATLTVRDPNNNPLISGGLPVTFSNFGGTSTVGISSVADHGNGTYSVTLTGLVGGSATTVGASINGHAIISVLPQLTVTGGIPNSLTTVSGDNQSGTVGSSLSAFSVLVKDSNGTPMQNVSVTWSITTGTGSLSATSSQTDSSGLATSVLTLPTTSESIVVKAQVNALSVNFNASAGAASASGLVFTNAPSLTGNTDANLTAQPVVAAKDVYGNVILGYASSISLSAYASTDCSGTAVSSGLTATTNPVAASSGVASFAGVKVLKTSVQSILASDGTHFVCSGAIAIQPGAVASASFTTPVSSVSIAGSAFVTEPVVTLYDANLNVATNASTNVVMSLSTGTGVLSGTTTITPVSGVATFTNLSINLAGAKVLTATSGSVTKTSSTFTINSGTASALVITQSPSTTGNTDNVLSTQPKIEARDGSNNVIAGYTNSIGFTGYSDASCTTAVTSGLRGSSIAAVAGVATWSAFKVAKTNVVALKATDGSISTACITGISISPGAIASIAFSTQPAPATIDTDTAFTTQPQVTAYDSYSNLVNTDSTSSVTLSVNDTVGCTGATVASGLGGTATTTLASGVALYSGIKVQKVQVKALKASLGSLTACSSALSVNAGQAALLTFTTQPSATATAGTALAQQPVVKAYDSNGNLKTDYNSSLSLYANSNSGVCSSANDLSGGLSAATNPLAASSGEADFGMVKILKANAARLRVSDGTLSTCSNAIAVSAGVPAVIAVSSGNGQSAVAGSAVASSLVAVVTDANSNLVSGATVTWTVTGGGSVSACSASTNASGLASCTFTTGTLSGTSTITASVSGVATPASFSETGSFGGAASIAVSSGDGSSGTAGSPLSATIVAIVKDSNLNPVPNIGVTWAVSGGGGSVSSCTTTTDGSGLVHCTYTLGTTAGTNTVTASVSGIATPATFTETGSAGTATKLGFATQPGGGSGGTAWSTQPIVAIQDQYGNTVTTSTASVALAISTNPSTGTLSGTSTLSATSGLASFSGLSINVSGSGYRLIASSTGLTSIASNAFNITTGSAAQLVFVNQPSNGVAGVALATQPSFQIQDLAGNLVTSGSDASAAISLTVASGGGAISGTNPVSASSGAVSFSSISFTTAGAKTIMATATLNGVSKNVTSNSFTISAYPVAPTLTLTSTNPNASTAATLTVSSCANVSGIYISESTTAPAASATAWQACSTTASAITYTLSSGDGTKTLYGYTKDASGNVSVASSGITDVLDTTTPTLMLSSFTGGQSIKGGSSQSITWTASDATSGLKSNSALIEISSDGGTTWTTLAIAQTTAGPYAWTAPSSTNSATYRLRVTVQDNAGNSVTTASTANFTIDSTAPTFTASQFSINSGASSTASNYVSVAFQATDNLSNIAYVCFKSNSTTAPAATDSCWTAISSLGVTSTSSITVTNASFLIGFTAGSYTVAGWLKDQAGNISTLTTSGTGTSGTDKASITYAPGAAPTLVNVIAAASASPTEPAATTAELSVAAGGNVYVQWKVSASPNGLPTNPISIAYLTNSSTGSVATGLLNGANGCTPDSYHTGCYLWTNGSPTSSYFAVRVSVTDNLGMITNSTSSGLNTWPPINFLAGNTDPGTGGSASSAVFVANTSLGYVYDVGALAVAENGTVYFRDINRGILMISPTNGVQTVLLPINGSASSSSGDGGPVSAASVKVPYKITLDFSGNLLIWDYDRIRKVNTSASPMTISTMIGGGSSTADNIAPTAVQFANDGVINNNNNYMTTPLLALPNGDIYFQSERFGGAVPATSANGVGYRIRVYRAASNQVQSIYVSGTGEAANASQAIATQSMDTFGPVYDPTNSNLLLALAFISDPTYGATSISYNPSTGIDSTNPNTGTYPALAFGGNYDFSSVPPHYVSGHDGNLYAVGGASLYKYNYTTNVWSRIVGTGGTGICADGTAATSCAINAGDMYVSAAGQVYFADRGKIRTLNSSSQVVTLMGQSFSFGDGGNALSARFNVVNNLGLYNSGSGDTITLYDQNEFKLREFPIGGTISTIAGTGNTTGAPYSTTTAANTLGLAGGSQGFSEDDFAVNPSNGDVFVTASVYIEHLVRSTGKWVTFAGGGSTAYSSADGSLGTAIQYPYFAPRVLGFDGTRVLSLVSNHTTINTNALLKLNLATDGTQYSLGGLNNGLVDGGVYCSGTAASSSCAVPDAQGNANSTHATHDSYASPNRWVVATRSSTLVKAFDETFASYANNGSAYPLATLSTAALSIAYRHDVSNNVIYY